MSYAHARRLLLFLLTIFILHPPCALSQTDREICSRPQAGSTVTSPPEIRSKNGVLRASLALKNSQASGDSQAADVHTRSATLPRMAVNHPPFDSIPAIS